MSITTINSLSQLNGILAKDKDKLSVIDFHATWCGPCHAIAPVYEALSKQFKNVNFLKCDVDAVREVAAHYKVSAMPTFVFLKGQTKVDEVRGANRSGLESTIRKHASGSSTSAFGGKGHTLGSSPSPPSNPPPAADAPFVPWFTNLDPQAKVLVCLLAAYFLFWTMS